VPSAWDLSSSIRVPGAEMSSHFPPEDSMSGEITPVTVSPTCRLPPIVGIWLAS